MRAGKVRSRSEMACWLTSMGATHNKPSNCNNRAASLPPAPICRQIRLMTIATITDRVNLRKRSPNQINPACSSLALGLTHSLNRALIFSSGGEASWRLLRSRWIARVCRTELFFFFRFFSVCSG